MPQFDILNPAALPSPSGGPTLCSDDDDRSAFNSSIQRTPRPAEDVPSYAKDTQSSTRKKPRRMSRRISGDGHASEDEAEDEISGYPGGPGMKGKSCYLVNVRLKTLPIASTPCTPPSKGFGQPSPRSWDWSDGPPRTSSYAMASPFFAGVPGSRDGGDKVPMQLSLSACSRLEYLYLRGNLLRNLWDTRFTPNLIVLDVSENELETLYGIEHLERLQHLYANSNALSSIEELPVLPNLTVLSLSCNRIDSLDRMQAQPSLEFLALADNNISSMAGLGLCHHLVALRLEGNPISKLPGYRLAVLLAAAACGMLELEKLDGKPFIENDLAQAACLAWPPRLSALYGWVPGNLGRTYEESFTFLMCLQKDTDKRWGCWLEGIDGNGVAEVDSSVAFAFRWSTFTTAELEERAAAAATHLRTIEADIVRMVAAVLCKGDGYLEHEEALSRTLTVLNKAEWKLASLPPKIRKVVGRVGGRGARLMGMRHQLLRLAVSARNTIPLPRLVQSVQWYRVDDWGNTEMINGATHQEYTVEQQDIGFTLKAESTCQVLNWQPLDLEDLQRYEEMGGRVDEMPEGADAEILDEDALVLGNNAEQKRASSEDAGPEITAKAFAYSRKVRASSSHVVEGLQILGVCSLGQQLSARWLVRDEIDDRIGTRAQKSDFTPEDKVLVRWWRSESNAPASVLVKHDQIRPGLIHALGAAKVNGSSQQLSTCGLTLLSESEEFLLQPESCQLQLEEDYVGCWIWVEVLRCNSRPPPKSASPSRDPAQRTSIGSGSVWARATTRVQRASDAAEGQANVPVKTKRSPPRRSRLSPPRESVEENSKSKNKSSNVSAQGGKVVNTSPAMTRVNASPVIAAVEISGGLGFMSPTNLSREIWRKDAWSAQNIYDSYQYAQHPDSTGIRPHSASEHSLDSSPKSPKVRAEICNIQNMKSPCVLPIRLASPEQMAFELNTNDQDLFPIITCSSLMTPRAGVWGGGGGGGGSGVGVGHPPPPPFPSPRDGRRGSIHRTISRASPTPNISRDSSTPRRLDPPQLTDLRTHSRADSRGSTDLQNGAHMLIAPPASAGSDTLVLTPDLPKEEREKRTSERERCIALLKEQLSEQTPADCAHRLAEVLSCSKLFEAPPAATPAERSTQGVHDEHVEGYEINLYHSVPSVRSDAEEAPSVRDVRITSEARGTSAWLVGLGSYSGGIEGGSQFLWTKHVDGTCAELSDGREIQLLPQYSGCKFQFSYLPVRADGTQGSWAHSPFYSADAALASMHGASFNVSCWHCGREIVEGLMCGKCLTACYCSSGAQCRDVQQCSMWQRELTRDGKWRSRQCKAAQAPGVSEEQRNLTVRASQSELLGDVFVV